MGILINNGKPLLMGGLPLIATQGWAAADPGQATSVTLTDIDLNQRLFQRTAGNYHDVTVSGATNGTTAIQARAVDADTGAVVVDWTTIDADPNGIAYTGKLRCPARIPAMKLEVRDASNTAVGAVGSKRFYVGAHWIVWGQSNAVNFPAGVYDYPLGGKGSLEYASGVFRRIGFILDTYPPNTRDSRYWTGDTFPGGSATTDGAASRGDGYVYLANVLSAALGCAVCLTNSSAGGQPLSFWNPGANGWANLVNAVNAIGGDAEGAILYQGEANANLTSTTTASYLAELQAKPAQFHSLTGRNASTFKFGVVSLGAVGATSGYANKIDAVRAAQVQFASSTPGAFLAAANQDAQTGVDDVHVNSATFSHLGAQIGRAAAALYGVGASGAGPRVVSATRSGAVITLNVQHSGGTALLDGAGGTGTALTGFRVLDGGVAATISATAITSPTTIALTLSAVPSGAVTVDYGMIAAPHAPDLSNVMSTPVFASAVYDNVVLVNNTRGCILQPFAAMAATGS